MPLNKNPKYDLKRKYQRTFELSLILSLIIIILSFKYLPAYKKEKIVIESPQELINVEDVVKTQQEQPAPPPPRPLIPIEAPVSEFIEDVEIANTELNIKENVAPPAPPKPVEQEAEEESEPVFFVAVEEMPEPMGGIQAIQQKIIYPELAKRAGIQGRVYVKAYVNESGLVTKVELIKGIGAGCDESAMEAVQKTEFKPGKQRGKPVKVQVTVPVLFKLV